MFFTEDSSVGNVVYFWYVLRDRSRPEPPLKSGPVHRFKTKGAGGEAYKAETWQEVYHPHQLVFDLSGPPLCHVVEVFFWFFVL